jgi:hypothetical protein
MSPKNIMTVMDVLKTIADDKSLVRFDTIALSNGDIDNCLSALQLTRKQYYSAIRLAKNRPGFRQYYM